MNLVINNKKIDILKCNTFIKRFVSLKFIIDPIDYGLFFPHKKIANTYLFCQKVDLCYTDASSKILYLYSNVRSEQLIIHLKACNLFILPLNTSKYLKVGDIIKI